MRLVFPLGLCNSVLYVGYLGTYFFLPAFHLDPAMSLVVYEAASLVKSKMFAG